MKHFTAHQDAPIDRKISGDLERIAEKLCMVLPAVRALVLVGGFGRGEGSVLVDPQGIECLNDYDVVVIAPRPALNRLDLPGLEKTLADEVNIWHVDLIPIGAGELGHLPLTMLNYDLKRAGYVFYGESQILDQISLTADRIPPLAEAKTLLFNRLISFVEGLEPVAEVEYDLKKNLFLKQQLAKVVLAICDAQLLEQNQYFCRYQEKVDHFADLATAELASLARSALQEKLSPSREPLQQPFRQWLICRVHYLQSLMSVTQKVLGRPFDSPTELAAHLVKLSPREKFVYMLRRFKHGCLGYRPLLCACLLLWAEACEGVEQFDSCRLERLHKLIIKYFGSVSRDPWEMKNRLVEVWYHCPQ